jgi:hypothetical protein
MLVRDSSEQGRAWRTALRCGLGRVRGEERGVAILTVIALITVGLAVGGVATVTATNAMRGSTRDESSKDALAAADAGAQVALHRQNQVEVSDQFPCVTSSAGQLAAGPASDGGWCAEFVGTTGDATWRYRVRPPVVTGLLSRIEIVSTGTSEGVTRRIHVHAESPTATAVFANSSVIGDDFITLDSNAQIFGNAGTNGDITVTSNADLCGTAQYGGGVVPAGYSGADCPPAYPYSGGPGTAILPPIDQGAIFDLNSNARIDPSNPDAPDQISGNRADVSWNPTNTVVNGLGARTLVLNSNTAITLGGVEYGYSFCRLEMKSNSALIVHHDADVRIFFDAPENCPGLGAGPQILLDSNSQLTTTDSDPGSLQLLVVGSTNPDVTSDNVHMDSNSHSSMFVILYAPNSAVELNSNSTLVGAVAGQSVHLDSNAQVTSHASAANLELPLPLLYRQTRYVECEATTPSPSAPSSSC